MVDILNVSTGRNFATEVVLKNEILTGRFGGSFALGLMAKDVGIAAGLGREVGLDAPVSRLISERLNMARDKLGPGVDNSAAIKAWGEELK
jgi:3-hydroxyisobutyrate dehydrogenase